MRGRIDDKQVGVRGWEDRSGMSLMSPLTAMINEPANLMLVGCYQACR
jgi:hypothetical protein